MRLSTKTILSAALTVTMAALAVPAASAAQSAESQYRSPSAITASQDDAYIYVAELTGRQITRISTKTNEADKHFPISGRPSGLALSADGKLLYITTKEADGKLIILNTESGKVVEEISVGHVPISPTLSPDESIIYFCNRFQDHVTAYDLKNKKVIGHVKTVREPIDLAITADGKWLLAANHLPTGSANVDYMTSDISFINTQTLKLEKNVSLPNGAINLRAVDIGPEGKYAYVPSTLGRFQVPTTQVELGWINTHALNIIDVEKQALMHTVLLDDIDQGAANPWQAIVTEDNQHIIVTHSGNHEVSLIDREKLFAKLAQSPDNDGTREFEMRADNPLNNLSYISEVRRRVELPGNSPRHLVEAAGSIYISEYISDTVAYFPLENPTHTKASSITLGETAEMDDERLGEMYFFDASLCYQQWQSCSTCHPDARADAVNWDLLNDGIGNPKNTRSMLFSYHTPPVMITGIRADTATCIRAGIQHIQFTAPNEEKANAIEAYMKALRPVPSPALVDGELSEAALRGKEIFEGKADCYSCHRGEYFTRLKKHDVGTGDGNETGTEFVIPTLREVWRTAPYLYDGRAATLKEIFTKYNPDDLHGETNDLSEQELDDLIEYVRSL
ncbi:cytochrome D1 domain-containing protein [Persicirhabdus sediminis]|uniref:C-type cytochrome n=1 Tax=Persicirhabdus sediminis TaxID=454144 RepID=A0A8J7MFG1_9BACT|nr:cytochrome D1 domain-containing protein [Persicirhabdus sediminis]MBK1792042.1 c-type cytochrome [Persicirhabdus sediminis]